MKLSRRVVVVIGLSVLLIVGLVIRNRMAANRAWEQMLARTTELIAEANARTTTRAVLRGAPEAGNAWSEYDRALILAAALAGSEVSKLSGFAERAPGEDRAAALELLAGNRAALPILRSGTRRQDVTFRYDWEERSTVLQGVKLLSAQALVALMVCEARLAREQGRSPEAARLLLDAVQFAADCQRRGLAIDFMVGISQMKAPLDELKRLIESRELAAADLAEVERELEVLDRDWPSAEIMQRNENLYLRCAVRKVDDAREAGIHDIAEWRHGFSARKMIADSLAANEKLMERKITIGNGPWLESIRENEKLVKELSDDRNPLFHWLTGTGIQSIQGSSRYRLAQVRMLRAAARYRRDGTRLELDDPFGAKLRHEVSGSTFKIWSMGRDGFNQQGTGDWNDGGTAARDIVLEVEK